MRSVVEYRKRARLAVADGGRSAWPARSLWRSIAVALLTALVALTNGRAGRAQDSSPRPGDAGQGPPDAQTFDGRVIGPDGEAVSGLMVLLHRVTNQGGAQLARSVSAEDGQFSLRYEPPGDGEGVYFVAARYNGRVYVGPMLRAPFVETGDYVMQVGVPGVGDVEALMQRSPRATGSVGAGTPAGPPPTPGGVFVAVLLSATIVIGTVLVIRGTGPSPRRRALIQLAEMDESGPRDASPSAFARKRRELLRRTREA